MRRALVLLAALLFAGAAFAQPAQLAPCLVAGTDCSSGSGVSGLTSGRVTLSTGATTVGDDAGLTGTGTGTGFKLGIGTDVFLSRIVGGVLVEDGAGAARDVRARTGTFGTSVVTPVVLSSDSVLRLQTVGGTERVNIGAGYLQVDGSGAQLYLGSSTLTESSGAIASSGPVRLKGYTVATLPAGTVGDTAYVTDATAPTYNGALTGGGAVTIPVFYNGSAWVSH